MKPSECYGTGKNHRNVWFTVISDPSKRVSGLCYKISNSSENIERWELIKKCRIW